MKYARIVDGVAVDVVTSPPSTLFTPAVAAQFSIVPDIEQGSVFLPVLANEQPTAERAWQPPRSFLEEYAPGQWRVALRDAVPAPVFAAPPARRWVTRLAFRNRFTRNEKVAIELAALDNPSAGAQARQLAAALRADLADQRDATYIDLDRADTRAGVHTLEALGLVGEGRADVILDAAIEPHEEFKE